MTAVKHLQVEIFWVVTPGSFQ